MTVERLREIEAGATEDVHDIGAGAFFTLRHARVHLELCAEVRRLRRLIALSMAEATAEDFAEIEKITREEHT